MGLQKPFLLPAKWPDKISPIDRPTTQSLAGSLVLAEQLTAGIKADPMSVKQLVNMWGEQQTIGTAQALCVIAVTPGLDMACYKKLLSRQPRHPASGF